MTGWVGTVLVPQSPDTAGRLMAGGVLVEILGRTMGRWAADPPRDDYPPAGLSSNTSRCVLGLASDGEPRGNPADGRDPSRMPDGTVKAGLEPLDSLLQIQVAEVEVDVCWAVVPASLVERCKDFLVPHGS